MLHGQQINHQVYLTILDILLAIKYYLVKKKPPNFSFKILMFPSYSYKYLFKEINSFKKKIATTIPLS